MFTHLIGSQPDHHRSSSTLFNRQTATEKTAPGPGKTCLPSSPALAAPAHLGVKSHQVKESENHRLQKCRFETGTSVDVPLLKKRTQGVNSLSSWKHVDEQPTFGQLQLLYWRAVVVAFVVGWLVGWFGWWFAWWFGWLLLWDLLPLGTCLRNL